MSSTFPPTTLSVECCGAGVTVKCEIHRSRVGVILAYYGSIHVAGQPDPDAIADAVFERLSQSGNP